jgi:hypothetical protein
MGETGLSSRRSPLLLTLAVVVTCCVGSFGEAAYSTDRAGPAAKTVARFPDLADDFAQLESRYKRQSFYPPDYYDAKLANAMETRAQQAEDIRAQPGSDVAFRIFACNPLAATRFGTDSEASFEMLADNANGYERQFLASGYSREVFAAPLLDYERRLIQLILQTPLGPTDADAYLRDAYQRLDAAEAEITAALAKAVEARRARLQPDQPPVLNEGECGAGESSVLIRPRPAGGRIWIIRVHSFYRCALRTRTPWNLDSCRWQETNARVPIQVSGRYFYQAQWPNRPPTRGNQTFEYNEGDGEGAIPVVIITP